MHIFITGGTGFIGQALIHQLKEHKITVLTRTPKKAAALFPSSVQCCSKWEDLPDFNDIDAVINLAGEPILEKRWSEKQKKRIRNSRLDITQKTVNQIQNAASPPRVFISGSAVGYYGDQGDAILEEDKHIASQGFSQRLCADWETIALSAKSSQTRVCLLRTGIVLGKNGGALKKMLIPYQLGLGGPLGKGTQYVSWIHIDDMVDGILHLLFSKNAQGPFNFTAPNPVTQKQWSQILAKTLHRPHVFFIPCFVLQCLYGEGAEVLLESQRAVPYALEKSGYVFQHIKIEEALKDLFLA